MTENERLTELADAEVDDFYSTHVPAEELVYEDDDDTDWEWTPSCEKDCEICGCHGDCYDCGTLADDYEVDYEPFDDDE